MAARKVNATKVASAATVVASVQPAAAVEYSRADAIKRLVDANAQQRVVLLSALPMGEVAAIGGKVGNIAASVNEVLNIKMVEKHGIDWVEIHNSLTANLSEADKTRKKAIHASLEGIRSTVQANNGGNKDKARDILRKVKDWGLGKHKSKQSNPKGNAKQPLDVWALKWENFPMSYRRIMNDNMESMTREQSEAMMVVSDAMAAYFKVCGITDKAVLDCTGESAWKH
jgi:chitinase